VRPTSPGHRDQETKKKRGKFKPPFARGGSARKSLTRYAVGLPKKTIVDVGRSVSWTRGRVPRKKRKEKPKDAGEKRKNPKSSDQVTVNEWDALGLEKKNQVEKR